MFCKAGNKNKFQNDSMFFQRYLKNNKEELSPGKLLWFNPAGGWALQLFSHSFLPSEMGERIEKKKTQQNRSLVKEYLLEWVKNRQECNLNVADKEFWSGKVIDLDAGWVPEEVVLSTTRQSVRSYKIWPLTKIKQGLHWIFSDSWISGKLCSWCRDIGLAVCLLRLNRFDSESKCNQLK